MNIWLLDAACALLVGLGIALVLKGSRDGNAGVPHRNDNPRTYVLRISGVMIAAFGFALGIISTVYHFA